MDKKNLISIILAFFAGLGTAYAAIMWKLKPAVKDVIGNLVDGLVDDIYPCRLIATIRFNQESAQTAVDFSQYKTKGIIGITIDKTESPQTEEQEAIDGEPSLYPAAVVYKLGEHWIWKVL